MRRSAIRAEMGSGFRVGVGIVAVKKNAVVSWLFKFDCGRRCREVLEDL